MNVGEIIKDSLKYPFSDWKKFLFLGILFMITYLYDLVRYFSEYKVLLGLLLIVMLVFFFIVYGYAYRIIKSSLAGENKLPEFNNWKNMFIDGLIVFIAYAIYIIPVFVFLFVVNIFASFLGIWGIIIENILYSLTILFVFIAVANKAYYENKSSFSSIFKVREILGRISIKGWNNFIKWYIATLIIILISNGIPTILNQLFWLIYPIYEPLNFTSLFVDVIDLLIITTYAYIFLSRSVALFYMPDKED